MVRDERQNCLQVQLGRQGDNASLLPPPVFNAAFAGETLPGVFEGQNTANLMLNVGRSYFHVNRPQGVGVQYPSCAFTSGLLADFMSRLGDAPLAAMEVECRSRGEARCRWLIGAPESLTALYEHMAQGADYQTILGGAA